MLCVAGSCLLHSASRMDGARIFFAAMTVFCIMK